MSAPKRIQRQRTKGWRMPDGAVYVGRPTKWGNPFEVRRSDPRGMAWVVVDGQMNVPAEYGGYQFHAEAMAGAVSLFELHLGERAQWGPDDLAELRGRDLACWCPLYRRCHADVLLRLASAEPAA